MLMTLQCIHFMQQWFTLSNAGMEEAFFGTPAHRDFAQLEEFARLPQEPTIQRFRHRLERHELSQHILATVNAILTQRGLLFRVGIAVDATLIPAQCSTKNKDRSRDPKSHSSKCHNQCNFGMKARIGVNADSAFMHPLRGTSGLISDIGRGNTLLHWQETVAFGYDAGYQGVVKRSDAKTGVTWHVAMRHGKHVALNKEKETLDPIDQAVQLKAGIWAKVEHAFRVLKRQFGFVKVRYRSLKKNKEQLFKLFGLSNLWMVRGKLIEAVS